jgi:NAD(P)-dependent dehydrogenase (short-subunit alcohol dehydrogenase family)
VALDPLASFRIDDRVAIVTGASSGLGARFARVLDGAGARLVLVARRRDRLETLARELRDATVVEADVADDGAPERVVSEALAAYGTVDILVNNAGMTGTCPAIDIPLADFRRVVAVDLIAPFALAQQAARAMVAGGHGGCIINISSIWGLVGIGQIPDAAYAASKAGLVGLTRELGSQWARQGIRVNAMAPGWFRSESTEGSMFGNERAEKWMGSRTPMGRTGEEHELDGALVFLASDASSFVTGAVLAVDGGWTAI